VQKLWLKNFEFHINPATWNTAQDLLQAGAVKNLGEVEKHFWVASVADGEMSFEVETIITPHTIKAFTCECWAEGRRLMCPHIAAALFKIRQFLDQQSEARQAKVVEKKRDDSGRLTTQTVLEQVSAAELLEFVRAYIRRDRDFALALKTWFAGSLSGTDNPFLLLLESALPRQGAGGGKPLREPDLRRLRKMLDDLEIQLSAASGQGNARAVYQIATAVLQKIVPLLPKTAENRRDQLTQYCQKTLHDLIQLAPEQLSPELRENRRSFLMELARAGSLPSELERDMVHFLGQAATDDRFFGQIRDLFDHTPNPAPPLVLHLFLSALARRDMPEAVRRVLEDYMDRPARIKDAIVILYYLNYWQAVLVAGEYFSKKSLFNTGQRREIEDLLLLSAEKAKDLPRQKRYLRARYHETGNPDLIQRLKTITGAKWPAEQKRLVAELKTAGNTERLAPLLAAGNDLDALALLIEEKTDIALLQQYEHLFWPERKIFVRDRYVTILSEYLTDHFGRQASSYIREQLGGLVRKGQTDMVLEIIRALTLQFADRHTLPEELVELFPKSKRLAIGIK